jgi:hypothetical protein
MAVPLGDRASASSEDEGQRKEKRYENSHSTKVLHRPVPLDGNRRKSFVYSRGHFAPSGSTTQKGEGRTE